MTQVSHRPIKCQSRLWSQRGTKVNASHRGEPATQTNLGDSKSRQKVMRLYKRDTNIKTVHQTSLLHIESSLHRFGFLKKNLNASRPSEYVFPHRGKYVKMLSRWDHRLRKQNLFHPDGSNIGSTVNCRGEPSRPPTTSVLQSGQITLQLVLINKSSPSFARPHIVPK